jgi:DNA-binding response OmpR family regulator
MPPTSRIVPRVLIIDPDSATRAALSDLLAVRCRVSEAGTLHQAVEQITLARPTIILMELEMPDSDALAFIRHLRTEPATRAISIACVTRRAGIRDKVAGFQAGADDYVVKPVNPASFVYRILLLPRLRSA